jgi:hypothetical protein
MGWAELGGSALEAKEVGGVCPSGVQGQRRCSMRHWTRVGAGVYRWSREYGIGRDPAICAFSPFLGVARRTRQRGFTVSPDPESTWNHCQLPRSVRAAQLGFRKYLGGAPFLLWDSCPRSVPTQHSLSPVFDRTAGVIYGSPWTRVW